MATKRKGGGDVKFYPYERLGEGGGGSHAEGESTTSFKVVFRWQLEVLAILKGGGAKCFHPLKGGTRKVLPCLEVGGGAKSFRPMILPFCSPPPPSP